MGRLLSTIYRTAFLAFGVAAVVFSILSATSCAFVKFDHQYKAQAQALSRRLPAVDANGGGAGGPRRRMQGDEDGDAGGDAAEGASAVETTLAAEPGAADSAAAEGGFAVDTTLDAGPSDASPAEVAPDAMDGTGGTAGTEDGPGAEASPSDASLTEFAPDAVEGTEGTEGSEGVDEVSETPPTQFAPGYMDGMGDMDGFEGNPGDSAGDTALLETTGTTLGSASSADTDTGTSPTEFAPGRMDGMGDMDGFEGNPGDSALDPAAVPASEEDVDTLAKTMTGAAASASGDAGLYCDGDQSFSVVTAFWGKSVQELATEIADVSDRNQSEEFARFGVLAASLLGALVAFASLFTSLTGFRICCERWILGTLALFACVLQGLTFLFFNSERYCDGDIINEILNQEPCVVGRGGYYSIGAMVLYALLLAMSCRLPSDDPYHPACNKNSAKDDGNVRTFVGSSKKEDGAQGDDDVKPANAPWLSEDKKKQVEEDNDII